MPLYEFRCPNNHKKELVRSYNNRDVEVHCHCSAVMKRLVSAPARTSWQWGDSSWTGYKDRGLGVEVVSKKHREAIMAQRGLREVQEGEVENHIRDVVREHDKHEAQVKTYQKYLADTGDPVGAIDYTFPEIQEVTHG